MAERIVSVKQIDEQFGPYHVTGTVTQLWDPEAARRIRQSMLHYMLRQAPPQPAAPTEDTAAD